MIVWGNKITISNEIGDMLSNPIVNTDREVTFTYINTKTGKETDKKLPLQYAITLAESRREDKRYKNFEYFISK